MGQKGQLVALITALKMNAKKNTHKRRVCVTNVWSPDTG